MSSAASSLNEFSRLLFIYGITVICFFGVLGSCANLYLFTKRRYRQSPCSLYIWMGSLFDLGLLFIALVMTRIPISILQRDTLGQILIFCKLRIYLLNVLVPVPTWTVCFSAFDRMCITSRDVAHRQWSTTKRAQWIIAILIILSLLYRAPDLYYWVLLPTATSFVCTISPSAVVYTNIQIYFSFPVLYSTAPIIVLVALGLRTRLNLRQFAARSTGSRLERHMTLMVLLQSLGNTCLIPYTINLFYTLTTRGMVRSEWRLAVENLISQLVLLGFYVNYASPFYIYLIASSDVRASVRREWQTIRGKIRGDNRITPVSATAHGHTVLATSVL